uniref:De novo designed soluble Rhomboid protease-like protein n=1 Tax=synthetic construct TaxID=32630 RepID=UPI00292A5E3E|nr:Chain A, De novo designed soluble Rhomboid protease-like protein [synthetic construct]
MSLSPLAKEFLDEIERIQAEVAKNGREAVAEKYAPKSLEDNEENREAAYRFLLVNFPDDFSEEDKKLLEDFFKWFSEHFPEEFLKDLIYDTAFAAYVEAKKQGDPTLVLPITLYAAFLAFLEEWKKKYPESLTPELKELIEKLKELLEEAEKNDPRYKQAQAPIAAAKEAAKKQFKKYTSGSGHHHHHH